MKGHITLATPILRDRSVLRPVNGMALGFANALVFMLMVGGGPDDFFSIVREA